MHGSVARAERSDTGSVTRFSIEMSRRKAPGVARGGKEELKPKKKGLPLRSRSELGEEEKRENSSRDIKTRLVSDQTFVALKRHAIEENPGRNNRSQLTCCRLV